MQLRWDEDLLASLFSSALLRYLAVAHFGRGRGEWQESEYPPFWHMVVEQVMAVRHPALVALWAQRPPAGSPAGDGQMMEENLRQLLDDAARAVLETLYPGALATG